MAENKKLLDIKGIKQRYEQKNGKKITSLDIAKQIGVEYQQVQRWGHVNHGMPKIVNRLQALSEWLGEPIEKLLK